MKCFHPNTFEKLGFDVILKWMEKYVHSEEALLKLHGLQPVDDWTLLEPELKRVAEMKNIHEIDDPFPRDYSLDQQQAFSKLGVEGNWLSRKEIFQLLRWLRGMESVREYLLKREEQYPELHRLVMQEFVRKGLIREMDQIIDERGEIRDDASPELKRIRRDMHKSSGELRNTLYKILRKANENNWSLDKEITIRNDRLVIPVRADARGRVPGFVQDISQSGGTVYIEPTEALSLNNHLRELQISEHNEIVRLLQELTEAVRGELPVLKALRNSMLQLELIYGKARLSVELAARMPEIDPEGNEHRLLEARYPLLVLKARQQEMEVIPLQLSLNHKNRIMVISGPNAGGKSVSMKTLGLLQLMLQCGFLIPVGEGTKMRLFGSLFLDIGDEQSVDSDLSTYTSRLFQWRQMGDRMNERSLFLIDEFGSGTDPRQGGAIAEAFLDRFVRQRAYGLITTHYGNLKDYAEVNSGVINGAMQFDTKELKPTFRLIEGMPGRSYAFEMAKRVGVHHTILKRARRKMGTDEMDSEQLLRELERKNSQLTRLVSENRRNEQKLEKLIRENESVKERLSLEKKQILRDAKVQARNLIDQANKRIENTIREIREAEAEKNATRKLRAKLKASAPEPGPEPAPVSKADKPKAKAKKKREAGIVILHGHEPKEGDWVKLRSSQSYGKLIDIQGKKGVLELGEIRMSVSVDQLQKIQPPEKERNVQVRVMRSGGVGEVQTELNLLGKRVEEALPEVDRLVDRARLTGLSRVRILHGKGSGILRDAIRKHLRDLNFVDSVEDAPVEEGGAGWTICTFS